MKACSASAQCSAVHAGGALAPTCAGWACRAATPARSSCWSAASEAHGDDGGDEDEDGEDDDEEDEVDEDEEDGGVDDSEMNANGAGGGCSGEPARAGPCL